MDAETRGLLGLLVLVPASLLVIVYVFLRVAGVVGWRHRRHEGKPPPPPFA